MEFQNFADPFGAALQYQGKQLANDSQAVANATNLYKLGNAKLDFEDRLADTAVTGNTFALAGGAPPGSPMAKTKQGSALPGSGDAATDELGSKQLFGMAKEFDSQAKKFQYRNPALSEHWASRAESTLKDASAAVTRELGEQSKFMDSVADFAAVASNGPEYMGPALAALQARTPKNVKLDDVLYKQFGLTQGPNGMPVYDPDALTAIGQFGKVGQEMMRLKSQSFTEQIRQAELDRQRKRDAVAEAAENRREAEARDTEQFGKLAPGMRWKDSKDKGKGMEEIPVGGSAANADSKGLSGQAYLDTLPEGDAGLVKGIADGRINPQTLSTRGGHRENVLKQVAQYKPDYQQQKYQVYQAVQKDFTSGTAAKNVTAINTATAHMGTLSDLGTALANNDTKAVNAILNSIATQFGDPRINNFETAASAVSSELMRVFRQVGASEKEQKEWETKFGNISSPAQIQGALKTAAALLKGRIDAVDDQWRRGMDSKEGYPNLLSPHSAEVLQKLGVIKPPSAKATDKSKPISLDEYLKQQGAQ